MARWQHNYATGRTRLGNKVLLPDGRSFVMTPAQTRKLDRRTELDRMRRQAESAARARDPKVIAARRAQDQQRLGRDGEDGSWPDRPAELADSEHRAALRLAGQDGQLSAAYRPQLGPPPRCGPGASREAASYYRRVLAVIDQGGWTRSECARLYRLRDKWKLRADGNDPRFKVVGNRSTGLTPDQQRQVHDAATIRLLMDKMEQEYQHAVRLRAQSGHGTSNSNPQRAGNSENSDG